MPGLPFQISCFEIEASSHHATHDSYYLWPASILNVFENVFFDNINSYNCFCFSYVWLDSSSVSIVCVFLILLLSYKKSGPDNQFCFLVSSSCGWNTPLEHTSAGFFTPSIRFQAKSCLWYFQLSEIPVSEILCLPNNL